MADIAPNSAIVLTPPGSAAIAVIRLRGAAVGEFLAAHFSRPVEPGRCVYGQFIENGRVLDDPVVVVAPDGTWADISVHGSTWIVSRVMEVAAAAGFVADDIKASGADSALTEAAQDDDSVLQREVYAYLPRARTRQAVRLLLAQPAEWRKLCERPAEADIAAVLRNYGLWWHLRQPRVAIVGPPNAGKSTLANALFGRERSITADLPGTTRDWVGEVADLDGLAVMLIDTPGQRTCHNPTDDAIEQAAIELSRREIARSDLTILVLDGSRELMPQQRPLFADYPGAICVRNKADLPCAWSVADVTSLAGLPTAATTKQGLSELVGRIRRFFDCDQAVIGPCWWTPRQREILQRALVDRGALSEI